MDLSEAHMPSTPEEDSIESWDTFEENALAKAHYFHRLTGLPTFADDSGLSVAALAGRPGVRSKRWSGRTDLSGPALDIANNVALVAELRRRFALPAAAEFVCAAAFADDSRSLVRTGRTEGEIVAQPRGLGGFGYDAHFVSTDLHQTFAEAGLAAKLNVSHRARAFTALLSALFAEETPALHKPGSRD